MTDVDDTTIENTEEKSTRSSRRALLGLTGAGIAGAVVMGPKIVSAATGGPVLLGTANSADLPTAIDNTNNPAAAQTPGTGGGESIKGVISGGNNGSHAILGVTQGKGHAIAGVIGTLGSVPDNTVAATWGRHYGQAAATEGQSQTVTAIVGGPANGVKGIVEQPGNGSHAVLGITKGGGHSVAGDTPDGSNTVAATWGRHNGAGAGIRGHLCQGVWRRIQGCFLPDSAHPG